MYVRVCVCMCIHVCICACMRTCMYVHVCMYMYTYVSVCIYVYTCIPICYTYAQMYVCMYVGIHVYLHISGCIIMCGGGRVRDLIEPTSCLPTVAGQQPSGHSFAPLPRCSCMAGIRASVG